MPYCLQGSGGRAARDAPSASPPLGHQASLDEAANANGRQPPPPPERTSSDEALNSSNAWHQQGLGNGTAAGALLDAGNEVMGLPPLEQLQQFVEEQQQQLGQEEQVLAGTGSGGMLLRGTGWGEGEPGPFGRAASGSGTGSAAGGSASPTAGSPGGGSAGTGGTHMAVSLVLAGPPAERGLAPTPHLLWELMQDHGVRESLQPELLRALEPPHGPAPWLTPLAHQQLQQQSPQTPPPTQALGMVPVGCGGGLPLEAPPVPSPTPVFAPGPGPGSELLLDDWELEVMGLLAEDDDVMGDNLPGLDPGFYPGLPPAALPPAGLPPAALPPAGLPPAGLPPAGLAPAGVLLQALQQPTPGGPGPVGTQPALSLIDTTTSASLEVGPAAVLSLPGYSLPAPQPLLAPQPAAAVPAPYLALQLQLPMQLEEAAQGQLSSMQHVMSMMDPRSHPLVGYNSPETVLRVSLKVGCSLRQPLWVGLCEAARLRLMLRWWLSLHMAAALGVPLFSSPRLPPPTPAPLAPCPHVVGVQLHPRPAGALHPAGAGGAGQPEPPGGLHPAGVHPPDDQRPHHVSIVQCPLGTPPLLAALARFQPCPTCASTHLVVDARRPREWLGTLTPPPAAPRTPTPPAAARTPATLQPSYPHHPCDPS